MEVVPVLQLLWRRRRLVAVGAIVAIAIAVLMGGSATPPSAGASTRVTLDTPQSQLVTDAPLGSDSLPWRATLLATLLGTDTARERIAGEVGIETGQLALIELELMAPPVPASLPRAAIEAAGVITEPYVLAVHTDDVLPVVAIETSAPDRAGATALAQAAVHALQAGASPRDTEAVQGLRIARMTDIDVEVVPGSSGRTKTAGIAIVLFALWCAGLALIPAIRGAWRTVMVARAAG
jgi:hypothetical protein